MANRLRRDEAGGSLVEFAIALPVVLALVMGLVDMSMLLWHWTSTVKATQLGAREASVRTMMVASPVNWSGDSYRSADFYAENLGRSCRDATTGNFNTAVDPNDFATKTLCPQFTVSCTGAACLSGFSQMLARMRLVQPRLQASNVEVIYASTGLGYVGRQGGNPMTVTVSVKCLTFDMFFLDAWYKWTNANSGCPSGTTGAQVAAASSAMTEGLSKPSSEP
ncbi:MAG: TadE/TadG family type IV pilus assembly protein [Beijerinckiaceae bacterium]